MENSKLVVLPGSLNLTGISKMFILFAQVALLVLIIGDFSLESRAFYDLSKLTFVGFIIHSVLPYRYRLPFFLLLSLAGIGMVLGASNAAWLLIFGIVLIGICHLPLRLSARVLLLLGTGALFATMRLEWIRGPWSAAIWPILGSMFMFRLIIYLYDLQHDKSRPSIWSSLSYFFLLPNVTFLLFPVVDFKTFRRTHYNTEDPYPIYQTGVQWMLRGIVQLLLYRYIYQRLTIPPAAVANAGDLIRFLLTNFLLYLRVSGQFHLIVGMLHLFGFNLPETHNKYYLASSFTDFWRRINIYWKDFMMKIFYYPVFFKLRKSGNTKALVLSTLVVFFATWLLHSYQWFWLRGSFPLTWPDALFWGILALLVVINTLYEAKHGRERSLGARVWNWGRFAGGALRTAGTFVTICILWSLWSSESISEWLSLWSFADNANTGRDIGGIPLLFLAAAAFSGTGKSESAQNGFLKRFRSVSIFQKSAFLTGTAILLLFMIGNPTVYSRLGNTVTNVIDSVRKERLSTQDGALLERGYYENLLSAHRFNSQLWEVYMKQPKDWEGGLEGAVQPTGDFLKEELLPLRKIQFKGVVIHTNRWGMRDKDYDKTKPTNTYRIALLGSSHTMGWGVPDNRNFESLLEARLNSEDKKGRYGRYEILNFAVPSYKPLQLVLLLEKKVLTFQPDAIFYVAHSNDVDRTVDLMSRPRHWPYIPFDYLKETLRRAGVDSQTPEIIAQKKLRPYGNEMLAWGYRRIVENCRKQGVLPVWIYLPRVGEDTAPVEISEQIQMAKAAGFITLDLTGVYDTDEIDSLRLAEWDHHPNAKGHQLVAARLYKALSENRQYIPLYGVDKANPETAQKSEERQSWHH